MGTLNWRGRKGGASLISVISFRPCRHWEMYWDITSLATSQVGHQLLFSRFSHVFFESDNPQLLTDYGTLFYSIQYSWLPNLWEKVTSGRTDKFGWWIMALWDWGRIWGLVGASLWLRSTTRLVNTLHYLMSLSTVYNSLQFAHKPCLQSVPVATWDGSL